MRISVLGDGGWGTTLAILLQRKDFKVTLWGAFPDYISYLNKKRINTKFLPAVKIPRGIEITSDLRRALCDSQLIILAIPSQYLRKVLKKMKKFDTFAASKPHPSGYGQTTPLTINPERSRRIDFSPHAAIYLSVIKGIEVGTLKRMSEVIRDELGNIRLAVLSGPTIAQEVVSGIPTTAVVASGDQRLRKYLQNIFMTERFRIYTNEDIIGVELGGSLKNIIAIACGISDGLGFGTNTKAALLSRGLAEISRLGQAMGAKVSTFSGISGLGDLVTTCISPYSRNRFVGEQIGKGKTLSQIKTHMQMVAEGVPTTKSAYALSLKYKVDMPITKEVYAVLYKNKSPRRAVRDLMTREAREE